MLPEARLEKPPPPYHLQAEAGDGGKEMDELMEEAERERGAAAKSAIRDEIRALQKEIAKLVVT